MNANGTDDDKDSREANDGAFQGASADETALNERLARLDKALGGQKPDAKLSSGQGAQGRTGYAQAVRVSSDFIAGVVVGAGLGWLFDRMLGTTPWGLIVFLLLGFAAAVLNVMRTLGVTPQPGKSSAGEGSRGESPKGE